VARNAGSIAAGARSRSCTKNSTSVAGMALAVPLTTNTAIRRTKRGWRQGLSWGPVCSASARAGSGTTAPAQAIQPSASSSANVATVAASPATEGSTAAISTPASASPSRQAWMRLRCVSVPPRRAPQAWCATLATL